MSFSIRSSENALDSEKNIFSFDGEYSFSNTQQGWNIVPKGEVQLFQRKPAIVSGLLENKVEITEDGRGGSTYNIDLSIDNIFKQPINVKGEFKFVFHFIFSFQTCICNFIGII